MRIEIATPPATGTPGASAAVATLVELLRRRAASQGEALAFTFLEDGEREGARWSWGELDRRARAIAARLGARAVPGDRALLLYPPGLDFIAAFFGCLYAGVVAVPAYPPHGRRPLLRLGSILANAEPRWALSIADQQSQIEQALGGGASGSGRIEVIATDRLAPGLEERWRDPGVGGEALAFLQYTSGSTGAPRGVRVSHRNLLHNQELIGRAFGHLTPVGAPRPGVRVVGWLPLYHDMGLIGNVLHPLYLGCDCVLMAPVAFLQRPICWLRAIERYRGTVSGGPNFAYERCLQKVREEERRDLDLSSWRVAFNGAEPIRSATLERFAAAFAPCGFARRSFFPCYGLAEATLFVSGGPPEAMPVHLSLEAAALAQHRVVESASEGARQVIGCGLVSAGQEVAIVGPESGRRLPEGRVGEVWVAGPSVAGGYWQLPEETAQTFAAWIDGEAGETMDGPFLRTGDLGFVRAGQLFITGRLKDLIILRGRNHYPQDLEHTAEAAHPALRPGAGAAFAIDVDGEERLVIACELERRRHDDAAAAALAVRRAVAEEHEVQVYEVVLLRFGGVPLTSSGKVQRRACRAGYLDGALPVVWSSRLAGEERADGDGWDFSAPAIDRRTLLAVDAAERAAALRIFLRECAARAARVRVTAIDPAQPLVSAGLDSLAAVELQHAVESALGLRVPVAEILGEGSLERLAEEVGERLIAAAIVPVSPVPVSPVPVSPVPAAPIHGAAAEHGDYPPSHGQRALWFLERLAAGSAAYHVVGAARVDELDAGALERALALLVDRHPALRTTFPAAGGEPVRRVAARGEVDFGQEDVAGWSPEQRDQRLRAAARQPFDLDRGPLLRLRVYRCATESVVLLAAHHLIADFWSLAVLTRELAAFYRQEVRGVPAALPAPAASYGDHVSQQEALLASDEGERLFAGWRRRLAGELPELDLPADRRRPAVQTFQGALLGRHLDGERWSGFEALARRVGVTPFVALLAAFGTLLGRLAGQREVLIGAPTSGRRGREFDGVVGYFVNPVALRLELGGEPSFLACLERARRSALAAFELPDYPFPLLVERLLPARDSSRSPVFQAMLVYQSAPAGGDGLAAFSLGTAGPPVDLGGWVVEPYPLDRGAAILDLTLFAAPVSGLERRVGLAFEYNTDLFDATTVRRWAGYLEQFLTAAVVDPTLPVGSLSLLSTAERHQLLDEWQPVTSPRRLTAETLHGLFFRCAARRPEATALIAADQRLSYGRLATAALVLSRQLQQLGVGPEVPVVICAERDPELVVAILAVLTAGGAYVPLDPAYPRPRLAFILESAQQGVRSPVLLAQRRLADRLPTPVSAVRTVWIEDTVRLDEDRGWDGSFNVPDPAAGRNLAYLIYTSGSTGQPKGVAIEHRSAVALVAWAVEEFAPEELAGVLAATSVCFDLSVFELFVPLAAGGTVILAENALALPVLPAACEVTLINTVPAAIADLAPHGLPAALRTVNLAGEALKGEVVRQVYGAGAVTRILNLYGPSEDTTYSTWSRIPRGAAEEPTIGRPLPGGRSVVLDQGLQLVPPGVVGELCLSGVGVARGYHGRPALTAERFLPNPHGGDSWVGDLSSGPGDRLYRTGDLVRQRGNGELEFLGRADHQVKIRGFRIELGEIEATLARHPAVAAAVVMARAAPGAGDLRLTAYVEPRSTAVGTLRVTPPALRDYVANRLPGYLVPGQWMLLEQLPRTANGKVDRKRLPVHSGEPEAAAAAKAPAEPIAEILAGLWGELLGCDSVGPDDNFFALGGHSLLAFRLAARVRAALGVELPLSAVFEAPTVAALARRVAAARGEAVLPPLTPVDPSAPPLLSFAQERFWVLEQLEPGTPLYNLPAAVRILGQIERLALAQALTETVARHDALRTVFEGNAGAPRPRIESPAPVPLPVVDLRWLTDPARSCAVEELAAAAARRPFDLGRAPLLRALLLAVADQEQILVLNFHHAAADGWSLEVFARQLASAYAAFAGAGAGRLPPLPIRYADFAAWQRRLLEGEVFETQLEYWRQRLGGELPTLTLPVDRLYPALPTARGLTLVRPLDRDLTARLGALCRRGDATLFMGLLTIVGVLLRRFGGGTDLLLGTPVANRRLQELEEVVGCFVNTLVLRLDLGGEPTFEEVLARTRTEALAAFLHQDLPFEKLVEELRPERQPGRNPLFQVMFTLQEAPVEREVAGLRLTSAELDFGVAKLDLTLVAERRGEALTLAAEFRRDLFDRTTIVRLLAAGERLLSAAVAAPSTPITRLPLLGAGERHQLLREWGESGAVTAGKDEPIYRTVARQAASTPEASALVGSRGEVTYGELCARAERLAGVLRRAGVNPGAVVALYLGREAAATAFLGVLAAGGAYLPLAPGTPRDRLSELLRDSMPSAVITDGRHQEALAAAVGDVVDRRSPVIDIEQLELGEPVAQEERSAGESPGTRSADESPGTCAAYLLYTSGSTGRPKGVVVPHRALAHLARAAAEEYSLAPGDRVLHFASPVFDVAAEELFPTWLAGAAAVVWDDTASLAPRDFLAWTAAQGVTVMNLSGSYWSEVVTGVAAGGLAVPPTLRLMITGSEAIATEQLARWRAAAGAAVGFRNAYGVTEATVTSALGGPLNPALGLATVPIGRPLKGVRIYLLERGAAVPPGVRGELHVGGAGVATGYLRRPARTAAAFVPDPCGAPGDRLYRTGDLARHRFDGVLEFLGRADAQVKVRGFRIELGEIEAALGRHPAVASAAAVLIGGDGAGGPRLVACVIPRSGVDVGPGEIIDFLRCRLPSYAVPAAVVPVESFPRTATGKVDRQALGQTAAIRMAAARSGAGAGTLRTPLEELVAGIFRRILNCEALAPEDDFFALGGHSLAAIRTLSWLRQELGVELPLARFFTDATVAGVALAVSEMMGETSGRRPATIPRRPVRGRHPAAFSQERLWFLDHLRAGSASYNLAGAFYLRGSLHVGALAQSVAEIVRRHGALATTLASEGGQILQIVGPPLPPPLPVVDLTALSTVHRQNELDVWARGAARRPFDLRRGPLLRLLLLRTGVQEHLLVVAMHHVISDAWSLEIFARELAACYGAFVAGERPRLVSPARQYADYAVWQREHLAGEELAAQVDFWRRRLAGAPTVLELPSDRPRPAAPTFCGARLPFALDLDLSAALAALSREYGATMFMTLLAAFEVLIFHLTGRRDFLLGTDVANRHRAETEDTFGFFVNSLVLRSDVDPELAFTELLARVRRSSLEAFAHQDLPFHKLVEALQPERAASRNPLFQVMFILQTTPVPVPALAGLTLEPCDLGEAYSVFDLTVSLELDRAGALRGDLRYSTELFDEQTIARLGADYRRLLRQIVDAPRARIAELRPGGDDLRERRRRRLDRLTRVQPRPTLGSDAAEREGR